MRITCPVCSTSIEVSSSHVGKKGRCTNCSSKFIIPEQPEDEYEILERGEVPADDSAEQTPSIMNFPARDKATRPVARFRVSRQESGGMKDPVILISGFVILVTLIVLFTWEKTGVRGNPSTQQAQDQSGKPRQTGTQKGSVGTAQAQTTREEQWPLLLPADNPPLPATPAATVPENDPAAEKKFELSKEKQSRALAYLKSNQERKRKGAYLAMRKLGHEAKPIYLQLLEKAKAHYLGQVGDIAFKLSVDENALTDFRETYEKWQDILMSVKDMVQTDWKKKVPQQYRQRHEEMDEAFAEVARIYSRTVTRAQRARRQDLSSLDAPMNILMEIAGETAWCQDRKPGKKPGLIAAVRNAGGAGGFLKIMDDLEHTDYLIRERNAAAEHNSSSNWATNAHRNFATLLNDRRVSIDLAPLRLDEDLSRGCRDHSTDMATNGYFSHTGLTSETRTFTIRARRAGFTGNPSGECIFVGNPAAVAAHKAWWYSDGHRLIMYASGPETLGLGTAGKHWTLNTAR